MRKPFFFCIFAYLSLIFALNGCGFRPIYAQTEQAGVLHVSIAPIKAGREGQILQTALEDALPAHGTARYRLQVGLSTESLPIAIDPDGTTSRYRVLVNSPYQLIRIADNTIIQQGTLKRSFSYYVSDADYSTYVASENVMQDGLKQLAHDYAMRVPVWLHNEPTATQQPATKKP